MIVPKSKIGLAHRVREFVQGDGESAQTRPQRGEMLLLETPTAVIEPVFAYGGALREVRIPPAVLDERHPHAEVGLDELRELLERIGFSTARVLHPFSRRP